MIDQAATSEVEARVRSIERRIAAACERSGRRREEIRLLGASKRQPVWRMAAAFAGGVRIFGENQVQEAERKHPLLPEETEWHLIGPLQSNKAQRAVRLFSAVHSVDRVKIARALDRAAGTQGERLPVFLELNLGDEASKHGFSTADLHAALGPIGELEHLEVVGLMAIPPRTPGAEEARPWFRKLRALRDEILEAGALASAPRYLSMGMSQDFEVAIEEGATHIRIGESLFGARA